MKTKPREGRILKAHAGYIYPELFVWFYLRGNGYDILQFKDHHIEILNALDPRKRGQQVNIQAPRGSAKTTCMAVWYPLWRICYKAFDEAVERQPETFICITGRDETMGISRLDDIKHIIETNDLIRRDFGELKGDPWRAKEVETANGITLRPLGRGQSPRGALKGDQRFTLMLADDIEDPEKCLNPDLREKDETWFFTDWMFAGIRGAISPTMPLSTPTSTPNL